MEEVHVCGVLGETGGWTAPLVLTPPSPFSFLPVCLSVTHTEMSGSL